MFNLQRRVRVLREQMQKKDLQIELLKRKLALIEEGARGKCLVQVLIHLIRAVLLRCGFIIHVN